MLFDRLFGFAPTSKLRSMLVEAKRLALAAQRTLREAGQGWDEPAAGSKRHRRRCKQPVHSDGIDLTAKDQKDTSAARSSGSHVPGPGSDASEVASKAELVTSCSEAPTSSLDRCNCGPQRLADRVATERPEPYREPEEEHH